MNRTNPTAIVRIVVRKIKVHSGQVTRQTSGQSQQPPPSQGGMKGVIEDLAKKAADRAVQDATGKTVNEAFSSAVKQVESKAKQPSSNDPKSNEMSSHEQPKVDPRTLGREGSKAIVKGILGVIEGTVSALVDGIKGVFGGKGPKSF